ncbi:MAG: hypothetical protein ACOC35_17105 [Promethearchaeia archaeon]
MGSYTLTLGQFEKNVIREANLIFSCQFTIVNHLGHSSMGCAFLFGIGPN